MDQTLKPLCRRVSGDTGGSGSSSQRGEVTWNDLDFLDLAVKFTKEQRKLVIYPLVMSK